MGYKNIIMGTQFRNFFIATVSLLGLVSIYRTYLQKKGPLLRVLVFHDVHDADWFKESILYLQKKYHVLTPDEYMEGRFNQDRINVLITFDDGYASWIDVCLPILNEQNIQALFFINAGLMDVFEDTDAQAQYVRERLMLTSRHTLSWDGVRQIKTAGHMIGGHTMNHVRLATASSDEQKKEIQSDKERIEAQLNEPIVTFAYPFGQRGDFSKETEHILEEVGYTHAFTTEGVFAYPTNRYTISRLCIEDTIPTTRLGCWVEGGYDVYQKIKSLCVR